MKSLKDQELSERLRKAAEAKQALLQKMRAMPGADDPAVIERKAAQIALAKARDERKAQQAAAKALAEHERIAREAAEEAERAARAALERAEHEAREVAEQIERAARVRESKKKSELRSASAAEQKAARDSRYAARKKRKG